MRTPHEEVKQRVINILRNAYEDDSLPEEAWYNEHRHNAESILFQVWDYIEPMVIRNEKSMTFDYGLIKQTLDG